MKNLKLNKKIFGIQAQYLLIGLLALAFIVYSGGLGTYLGTYLDTSKIFMKPEYCRWECESNPIFMNFDSSPYKCGFATCHKIEWIECNYNLKPGDTCDIDIKILPSGLSLNTKINYVILDQNWNKLKEGHTSVNEITRGAGVNNATFYDFLNLEKWQKLGVYSDFDFKIKLSANHYQLNFYDSGAKITYNSVDCNVNNVEKNKRQFICTSGNKCTPVDLSKPILYDTAYNYICGFNLQPTEASVVKDIDNSDVACLAGIVYSLDEITLAGWDSPIKVLGDMKATYGFGQARECCPGQTSPNAYCDSNWKWVYSEKPQENIECITTAQCMSGALMPGGWLIDYKDPNYKTLVKYECQAGKCKETAKAQVECTQNYQCPPDKPICNTATYQCMAVSPPGFGGEGQVNWLLWILLIAIVLVALIIIGVIK